mgnify:FL=1
MAKFGVIVFPGSNCDHDAYHALAHIFEADTVFLWHKDHDLQNCDVIIIPGGFSYGDYLRSGAIARFSPIMEEVIAFAGKGGLVLGICNGFQVLLEAGLLPGAMQHNKQLRFVCKQTNIRCENNQTPFTRGLVEQKVLKIPVAHGEGNYYIDDEGLQTLKDNRQIVFRYCTEDGTVNEQSNVNGSVDAIAGICNQQGNVLGMMPHPERAVESVLGSSDGYGVFASLIKSVQPA